MRKTLLALLAVVLLWPSASFAREVPANDLKTAQQLLSAIRKGDKTAIAKLVRYPITRKQPIPPIRSEKEFVENFEDFFDSETIPKILASEKDIWNNWRGTAIGPGLLWIDGGKIFSINLSTARQEKTAEREKDAIVAMLHPSARAYDRVAFLCNTKSYQIRIHEDNGTLRYYSWKTKAPLLSKPDLVLAGQETPEGNGGNSEFSFKSGDYTYLVKNTVICGKDCHSYLIVEQDGKAILKEPCEGEQLRLR